MSPGEIGSRLAGLVSTRIELARFRRGRLLPSPHLKHALLDADEAGSDWATRLLTSARARRSAFYPCASAGNRMRALFESRYARERQLAVDMCAAARRHEFAFFGRIFRFGASIDWHADPVSGRRWPNVFYADVPIHGGSTEFGDVKFVWELNRQQFVGDLAKGWFLDLDRDAADEIHSLVRSWIADNPYGVGVNWASPLEPAFRAWSWIWAYHLCLDAAVMSGDTQLLWMRGFLDHGHFLYRHLEHFASPYNHLIGEASALYALGVLFPWFREAARWRSRGRHVLESRLRGQFYDDGGSVEQATFYHHATLGFYLLAALLGRRNGDEFAHAVWEAIERGIEFSMRLMQPDGRIPAIGDVDDGKSIRLEHRPFWDFRAFQAVGAVLFGRSDFKYAAGGFPEDALWLLGPEGLERFDALPSSPPAERCSALRTSGYYVLRSDWASTADYICFDCGELAGDARCDSVPNSVHGHADCLAVTAYLGGRPVLVDAGSFTYNGDPAWERHFRGTPAHNTAMIDQRDQAVQLAKMAWAFAYRPRLEHWQADERQAIVTGSHDGYVRGSDGVVHRRTVWLRPGGYFLILDEFEGQGGHDIEVNFHLPPASARLEAGYLATDIGVAVHWMGSSAVSAELRQGGAQPDEGWIAPSLGVRVAVPRLRLRVAFSEPSTRVLTLVADSRRVRGIGSLGPVAAVGERTPAFTVVLAEGTDSIIAAGGRRIDIGGLCTDARIAIWREAGEHMVETIRVGGTYQALRNPAAESPDGLVTAV
jgi:hypothetical protein